MKLLFDHNLSPQLPRHLAHLFPDATHVRALGLQSADDVDVWNLALRDGLTIATKDSDFEQRSLLYGYPPKVVCLKVGNCSNATVRELLTRHAPAIDEFHRDEAAALLLITLDTVFKVVHPPESR